MSKQTVVDVTESRYHKGTFTIVLSCGCDYTAKVNVEVGDESNCSRCPITVEVDEPETDEPSHDDTVNFCPNCERPNQFGELCVTCQREEQEAIDAGERWADEGEGNGNGYPSGTIGAETR